MNSLKNIRVIRYDENLPYIILASVLIVLYFLQSFFLAYGGIGADGLSYFGIAAEIPYPSTNLFPVGFPVFIKMFYLIFQDYFWATKFLNISLILFVFLFSYFKDFFFQETVMLFTLKTCIVTFVHINSEAPFLFVLYFLIFQIYQIVERNSKTNRTIFWTSLLLFCLFVIRYSGIYIWLGLGVFGMVTFITGNKFRKIILKILGFSGIGIFCYLLINYLSFGSFTGEHLRGMPKEYYLVYIYRDFVGVINAVNPIIGIKPSSNSIGSLSLQFFILVFDILLLIFILKNRKKLTGNKNVVFHKILWVIALVYAIGVWISGYFQQIEEMNLRMMAASNFCITFSILIMIRQQPFFRIKLWRIGIFSLLFLMIYQIKKPENYLQNRNFIAKQMPPFQNKKYIYNDERAEVKTTVYRIPFTEKTFTYNHTNLQIGEIKQSIAGSINPTIKWLKQDTIKDKSKVLYTSELKLPR